LLTREKQSHLREECEDKQQAFL